MTTMVIFAFLLLLPSTFNAEPTGACFYESSVCGNVILNAADRVILLAFKDAIYSESSSFSDWNASLPCSAGWTGVCTDAGGRVTEISLPLYFISGIIPNNFGKLIKLRYLNLRASSFPHLPSTFGSLSSLLYLDLGYNLLDELSIPPVKKLRNLRYLDLSFNRIWGGLPALTTLKSLELLDVSGNFLSGPIPANLDSFKNLSLLYATANNLCGRVPSYLGTLPNLQNVNFAYNFLYGTLPAVVEAKFCDSFTGNCLATSSSCDASSYPSYRCENGCKPIPNLKKDLAYRYGVTNASSSTVPFTSINAIDGSAGKGNFSMQTCIQTLNETDPNLQIDLSSPYAISTVQLYNRLDCCSENLNGVRVYVGPSGEGFNHGGNRACKDSHFVYSKAKKGFPLTVNCNIDGRYVWVVVPGENKVLSLCEVVVLGRP